MSRLKEDDYRKAIMSVSSKIYNGEIPATKDMDILVWAAKKQIGKKPVAVDGWGGYLKHRCPSCNYIVDRSNNYCSECGRKLEWRSSKGENDESISEKAV